MVSDVADKLPLRGVLANEGQDTGDCRRFDPGSLRWDEGRIPLEWGYTGQHDPTKHVGWVENIERVDNEIRWNGHAFDPEYIEYQLTAGRVGGSVVCDDETYQVFIPDLEQPKPGDWAKSNCQMQVFSDARLRAFTILTVGAIAEAYSEPAVEDPEAIVASVDLDGDEVTHAGIMLVAMDTGRVLMLQRSLEDGDSNGGLWEFPGGSLDEGETPEEGARREFAEEVGVALPETAVHFNNTVNGGYTLHGFKIDSESEIDIDSREEINPDDPDGDKTEALAWWEIDHINEGAPIRPEVLLTPLPLMEEPEMPKDAGESLESGYAVNMSELEGQAAPVVPAEDAEAPQDEALGEADESLLTNLTEIHGGIVDLIGSTDQESLSPAVAEYATGVLESVAQSQSWIDELLGQSATPTEADSLVASVAPVAPPDEWFEPFELDGPTPITVTPEGRIFGHLADWKGCHGSSEFAGVCMPPPSDPDAKLFHLGQVLTASGALLDVGRVTVGGGHADRRLGVTASIEHYDDVSTCAGVVRVKEDEHGIGLFGSVVPGATPEMVADLRRSPLSGDWRKDRRGGRWRLVAAHAVNAPGYAIPRGQALVASVSPQSFITFGRVCGDCGEEITPDYLPDSLVASVRTRLESTMASGVDEIRMALQKRMGFTAADAPPVAEEVEVPEETPVVDAEQALKDVAAEISAYLEDPSLITEETLRTLAEAIEAVSPPSVEEEAA